MDSMICLAVMNLHTDSVKYHIIECPGAVEFLARYLLIRETSSS